ncbi:hypothetical protein J5N97_026769 [Dioscorea zingiberensis]|uniref:Uncharacterized protein n=1 Tax=Dioscorea zingiberensis TaxID=325984 RepID=A0A9D5C2Z5_9LILI|nr:hypothetical protein J5N97_026769 [Dioscorea zingiberensis]
MLHSLLLPTDSRPPLLSSRHVHTYKHLLELHAGVPILPATLISFHGLSGLLRVAVIVLRILTAQFNPLHGIGLANTSLLFFSSRVFALCEFDLPYSIFISPLTGDTTTISRHDFNGHLHTSMTAHPKLDPITGELLAFRYSIIPPFLTFFRLDHLGRKLSDVPIFSLRQPTVLHDFAITQRFAVFSDVQLVMKPSLNSPPVQYDTGKTPRLGLLPRDAINDSDMQWFDVPGFNMMHSVNAWDEDGGSVVVLVGLNIVGNSMKHISERLELVRSRLEIVLIEVNTERVSRTSVSLENLEFGSINQGYVGRRNRYVYAGVADPTPKISGFVKVDLELAMSGSGECVVGRREFGPGCYAGEPCFVPAREDGGGAEDEGYLVTYVHDEKNDESRFVVMDARSPEMEVVAEVVLPQRVPYGFHGVFLTESQLRSQRPLQMQADPIRTLENSLADCLQVDLVFERDYVMAERMQCRLWWPEWLLSSEPSSGFLLFGWFMNAGEDVVVAAAVPPGEISIHLHQSELQELLCYVNERMPLLLHETSTFTVLGHCAAPQTEGDLNMEHWNKDGDSQSNDGQQQYFGPEQSSTSEKAVRYHNDIQQRCRESCLEKPFAENCRRSTCGCETLDQGFELFRQSSTRCGTWIQLIPKTQAILYKEKKWVPKFHHMHLRGHFQPICEVHLIVYKPPMFGSHHFTLNSWGFEKEVGIAFKRPNWVAKLQKKPLFPDMDSVVLAINCSSAAKVHCERRLRIKDPQIHFRSMLSSMIWHVVAALVSSVSSIVYSILQLFRKHLVYGSQGFFFRFLREIFRHTSKNIQIRSHQFLYWPVFLQAYGFSSSANVEYLHRASLRKHFIWSNVAVDLLLGNVLGLILLANVKVLSFWIMLISRDLTDNLLRSGFAWLMGVPAGFKLNTELAELLGMVSLNAIQAFSTFWFFASSFLKYSINGLSLLGVFMGLTVQAALCIDMLKLATLHISILHWLISLIYTQQIKALASLWRLFRGRKWNPLRQRLDSYEYTVEQHVVGSLVFTPLLLLLPTTSVFYIFITMLSTSISFTCLIMEIVISILHKTPYFEILLWIVRRRRFPSGLWFQIVSLSSVHSSASSELQHEDYSPSNLVSKSVHFGINEEPGYLISIVQSNCATLGQVISPYYSNVLRGFSLFSETLSLHRILMGERIPSTSGARLHPTIPWMHISNREYWKLCYSSVLACRSEQ